MVPAGLEADATAQYVWNSENELVGIGVQKTGAIYGFGYDGLGRRTVIASGANGAMTTYMNYGWCGRRLCQLRDGNNNPVRRYLAEGEVTPSQGYYYYYGVDQVGSVRDVLDATTGTSVKHYDYAPYGQPLGMTGATATDFRYAGLFYHQPTGLYFATRRVLDPTDGHWESRDPLGERASINLYAYAGQNPVGVADPAGTGPINAIEDGPTYTSPVSYTTASGTQSVWYPQTADSTPPPQVAALSPPLSAGSFCVGEAGCEDAPTQTPSSVPAYDPACNCTVDFGQYQDPSYSLQGCATCTPETPQQMLADLNEIANGTLSMSGVAGLAGLAPLAAGLDVAGELMKTYIDAQGVQVPDTGVGPTSNLGGDIGGVLGALGSLGAAIGSLF
jgi:RHS repeat-associated protein